MNEIWQGRYDGDDLLHHRIFQRVQILSENTDLSAGDFVLHGFSVDDGVERNKGRIGARNAPDIIRKNMSNFPVVLPDFRLFDGGNVSCENDDLEAAQNSLADKVAAILQKKAKSIVLGGGHEVMFGHFSGICKAFPKQKIGVINIDAHFDNRKPEVNLGTSSGTGFWQMAQQENTASLHIGIQRNSNTLKLFDTAHHFNMKYILADELFFENLPSVYQRITDFAESVDVLYVTVCMDVFNAAIAPGVSAPAYNGIFADAAFMHMYRHILRSTNLVALDVAEVNPEFDIQNHTARLAASLMNEWMMM